ncbi:MAG: polyphosphate kinase 2 family protein [Acidimicrobiales bacterium]
MTKNRWRVKPGNPARLARIDPASRLGAPDGRKATDAATAVLGSRLAELHDPFWAERKHALLLVLQAMDTGGKDGTIKHVLSGINSQGVRVASFKAPSENERDHDFLWRVHSQTPARGEIGVFNRSHYEDVLIVRVHDLVPEKQWRARYDQINAFEELLVASGTTIVKCFLHISKEEQARRLQARLDDPDKGWKFNKDDLLERAHWDEYQEAYEEAITRTSTAHAPWHVIPANHKHYRNFVVSQLLVDALESLNPKYPPPDPDLDGVVVT